MSPRAERKFDAVLFDLTALLNSWALWNLVAASPEDGRKWRAAFLRRTYETGAYHPYETLVAEAAAEVGHSPTLAEQLAARCGELKPWPEVREVLGALRREGVALVSSRRSLSPRPTRWQMRRSGVVGPGPVIDAALGAPQLERGEVSGVVMTSVASGAGSCGESFFYSDPGTGAPPKVEVKRSGDCGTGTPAITGGNRQCFRRLRRPGQVSRALSRHRRWGRICRRPQRCAISRS